VPFDPKKALERLLTLEATLLLAAASLSAATLPTSEQYFSTPKNQHEVQKLLEETGSTLQNAVEKKLERLLRFLCLGSSSRKRVLRTG